MFLFAEKSCAARHKSHVSLLGIIKSCRSKRAEPPVNIMSMVVWNCRAGTTNGMEVDLGGELILKVSAMQARVVRHCNVIPILV